MRPPFEAVHGLRSTLTVASLFCAVSTASAQFSISRMTIDGGGCTRSTGGTFAVGGTVGQPDAGYQSGANFALSGGFWFGGVAGPVVAIETPGGGTNLPYVAPLEFHVNPASPNPFAQRTVFGFDLPSPRRVRAALYDASGRLVRLLADEPLPAGKHERAWDRRDRSGRIVSSGVYFLRLDAEEHRSVQKLVVIR